MRYSSVFFTTLLGSTAATQVGYLQDRDFQELSERDENLISGLVERGGILSTKIIPKPPRGKGSPPKSKKRVQPKKTSGPPGMKARPRNLDDLDERDVYEDNFSQLLERRRALGIGMPKPPRGKGRPPKSKKRVQPKKTPGPPGMKARPGTRPRDLGELEERDVYEDSLSQLLERRRTLGIGMPKPPRGKGSKPKKSKKRVQPKKTPGPPGMKARPGTRPRDLGELEERDIYWESDFYGEE